MKSLFVMFQILFIVPAARSRRAFLDIILYEINENDGRYTMRKIGITGEFSNAGTTSTAEGDIIQMHPRSLCGDFQDSDKFDYGWVGVVKLSYHGADPCHLVEKAKRAVGQGATAVIFDISDHPDALHQLNEHPFNVFNQPIVLVKGVDATQLMRIISGEHIARAVIKQGEPDQSGLNSHFTDPAFLVTCILLVVIVFSIAISKIRCRKRQQQASLRNWTIRHSITKKYEKDRQRYDAVPQISSLEKKNYGTSDRSSASLCAICLESFQVAQNLRVLECQHEFHIDCIDTWLIQKRSCPLCNRSFSNLSAKSRSAAHRSEDSTRRQISMDGTSPALQAQVDMQQIRPNLMDVHHGTTSYGTVSNDNVASLPLLSNSTDENRDVFAGLITSNSGSSDAAQQFDGSSMLENQTSTVPDHKDSLRRSHRKRNPRLPLKVKAENSRANFHIAPLTKSRAICHGAYHYLRQNCDFQDMNFSTDSSCVEQPCDENCNCRINGASETSIQALHGSLPLLKSSSSSFISSLSNTSKCVEYSSDPPIVAESEFCELRTIRSTTPCIEYSSSDGASNLCWLSYSTLEDVLGAIDGSTSDLSN